MANATGQVPVVAVARESWVFFLRNWRLFLPAAGVTAVISALGPLLLMLSSAPAAADSSEPSLGPANFLAAIPGTIAGLLFAAAVLRKVIRDEFSAPTGLALGADELRLLGVMAGLACIIIPFGTLAVVIIQFAVFARLASNPDALNALMSDPEALSEALETTLGPAGMMAFTLFLMLMLGLLLYAIVRLSMINAATIGERRMVMFQTWKWSRGNILRIFGALLLTGIPTYLVSSLFVELALAALNAIANPSNMIVSVIAYSGSVAFVGTMLSIPSTALGAILYKGLRPADFVAK